MSANCSEKVLQAGKCTAECPKVAISYCTRHSTKQPQRNPDLKDLTAEVPSRKAQRSSLSRCSKMQQAAYKVERSSCSWPDTVPGGQRQLIGTGGRQSLKNDATFSER